MVRNIAIRNTIKDQLKLRPHYSDELFRIVKKMRRRTPTKAQFRCICSTDIEIQYLSNKRWGLRSIILEQWGKNYLNETEKEYLSSKTFSDNLKPERKYEFEFFRSLRDIINEGGGVTR